MFTYVFKNKKNTKEEILQTCKELYEFNVERSNQEEIYLSNAEISILIKKDVTHILLKDNRVNIKELEDFFGRSSINDGISKGMIDETITELIQEIIPESNKKS